MSIECDYPFEFRVLEAASYLTDPICKVREYFYGLSVLNETCKSSLQKIARVAVLILGMIVCALAAPFTAPFGAALRGIVAVTESKPYIYLKKGHAGKSLVDGSFTIVSYNACEMPGGYSITDGQVTPASDKKRLDANIEELKKINSDIICLYEIADICDAKYISSKLSDYPFVIPVAGVRGIGPSSMMYVASKYEIDEESIQFVPFIKGIEVTGRAKFSEKGYLSFEIKSDGKGFATVVSTHLQHSEIPGAPTPDEVAARGAQMKKIGAHIQNKVNLGKSVIFTGDLNQSEEEIGSFFDKYKINWLRDPSVQGKPTWGGDHWCANLMGKTPSESQVLDYTFATGKVISIKTEIFGTGYSGLEFRPDARSDHSLLLSRVELG